MEPFPVDPQLGDLRVATPDDILRCGIVASASFRYSSLFRWERPYHKDFPEDTLLSYRTQAKDFILRDDIIVIVSEDAYEPDEKEKTEAIIPAENGWSAPAAGEKVVVGWAAIILEPDSKRKGQYIYNKHGELKPLVFSQPAKRSIAGHLPDLPHNEGRDLNKKHYDSWGSKVGDAKKL